MTYADNLARWQSLTLSPADRAILDQMEEEMKHARSDYDRIQDPDGLIPDDEPVFLLRAKDVTAPAIVRRWAEAARAAGADDTIINAALWHANVMEAWQRDNETKIPDMPKWAAVSAAPHRG